MSRASRRKQEPQIMGSYPRKVTEKGVETESHEIEEERQ